MLIRDDSHFYSHTSELTFYLLYRVSFSCSNFSCTVSKLSSFCLIFCLAVSIEVLFVGCLWKLLPDLTDLLTKMSGLYREGRLPRLFIDWLFRLTSARKSSSSIF